MTLELYGHPFSSYTWKAKIALYENDTPFTFHDVGEANNGAALARHWPPGKFPLLVTDDGPVMESSIVIEYLDRHYPGRTRFIPQDPDRALEMRMLDRVFDDHVMTPVQAIVSEHLPFVTATPDKQRIARAREALDKIYPWLERWLIGRKWASDDFGLAECAAAPALFYADWVHRIPGEHARLQDYRARLLARPSVARCVEEARPYRHLFPLGAPDRD